MHTVLLWLASLRWRHNGCNSVSNHQPRHCLLNRLFRRRSKKTSKLRVTGLCAGNSPGTGEFPAQMASYAENVSTWWRHHVCCGCIISCYWIHVLCVAASLTPGRLFHSSLAQPSRQAFCLPFGLCKGTVTGVWKKGGNSHWSREPIMQWGIRQSQSIFRPTNHKSVMPDNWRPSLIPNWQSYCHQAGNV